eukprot:5847257-Pyramimonas_sp.AAC.1
MRLINEFDQDQFAKLDEFVKALILILNAERTQQQLSNLRTRLDIDSILTLQSTKQAVQKVLGDNILAKPAEPGGFAVDERATSGPEWASE